MTKNIKKSSYLSHSQLTSSSSISHSQTTKTLAFACHKETFYKNKATYEATRNGPRGLKIRKPSPCQSSTLARVVRWCRRETVDEPTKLEASKNVAGKRRKIWRLLKLHLQLNQGHGVDSRVAKAREALLKGKTQYSWSPSTNWLGLTHFYIENINYLLYKTSDPNEEVNCTKLSPLVSFPC